MEYPDNFETRAYPAGKSIAVSRIMAIWTCVAFGLVLFLCGILLWSARSERLAPFMISANSSTGEWKIVGNDERYVSSSAEHTIQESLVGKFVQDWFEISSNADENKSAWLQCDRATCMSGDTLTLGSRTCSISCSAGDELYSRFAQGALPGHESREKNGATWHVNERDLSISPSGKISDVGGTWVVNAKISSNSSEKFDVKIFIKVARNNNYYQKTMGFYIADFNAYRMN